MKFLKSIIISCATFSFACVSTHVYAMHNVKEINYMGKCNEMHIKIQETLEEFFTLWEKNKDKTDINGLIVSFEKMGKETRYLPLAQDYFCCAMLQQVLLRKKHPEAWDLLLANNGFLRALSMVKIFVMASTIYSEINIGEVKNEKSLSLLLEHKNVVRYLDRRCCFDPFFVRFYLASDHMIEMQGYLDKNSKSLDDIDRYDKEEMNYN